MSRLPTELLAVTGSFDPGGTMTTRRSLLAAVSGSAVAVAAAPAPAEAHGGPSRHWVHSWVSMPQLTEPHNMPPAPFTGDGVVFADATLRQTVRLTAGGRYVRLRFSNAFGGADLPLTSVAVALPRDGRDPKS